ncbi:formyltransferase family protein [Clostridium tyrobutyricum]|uniref:formyltransferase family protein n=1 Tax=Clostridium tyrobutyricum TaxID=1519 RepID=UPI0010AA1620|nr:formyltransferase family protein [Clostridium tyrobutyricum]QCH26954.1 Bifunctional polymyxin resistance protein ArnA [Clostridium tyrobutyricum]
MKVIFIGGLKNGKYITKYLNNHKDTELLKVYTLKDELGEKISDFVTFDDLIPKDKIVKVNKINDYENEISKLCPDIIFVVGWSQLISENIIKSAKIGVIGFHPAKLPKDRGRSVLAWQISEGYTNGAVSMIWIDSGIDSGNIIGQKDYIINYNDTIRDVLDKVYNICLELTETYYPLIVGGNIISIKQDNMKATYRRKRNKKDSIIKWNRNSIEIYNLVRAITDPYPGTISYYNCKEFIVLNAYEYKTDDIYSNEVAGTILEFKLHKGMIVKTKDNGVLIDKIKLDNKYIIKDELQKYFLLGDKLGKR